MSAARIKVYPTLIVTWLLAGFGAVVGSILGNAFGTAGLWAGAIGGGALTTVAAVALSVSRGWLPRPARGGALVGGLVGFAVAAPLAVANLHTPLTPIVVTSLAGIGVLLGAGVTSGRTVRDEHGRRAWPE